MKHSVSMNVNGSERQGEVESRTLLVHHIRENLGLTGTHIGCDTSQCGACTILMNGKAVKSCPGLLFDGRTWMAFWTDEAGSDWGRWSGTQLIAVSTLDGEHDLLLRDMPFPPVWDRQFTPTVLPQP